jgi:hypothetical protein
VDGVTVSSGKPLCRPDGTPFEGKLYFTGPDVVTVAGQEIVLGGTTEADLEGGQFSATLAASDTSGMSPSGWTYKVTAAFSNAPGWVRYIALTKANPVVSLADVIVPDPVAGNFTVLADPAALLAKAQNLADLPDKAEARSNLGLALYALLTGADFTGDVSVEGYATLAGGQANNGWSVVHFLAALAGDFSPVHRLDADTGVASLGAKNGLVNLQLCGFKNSAGAPSTGNWTAGDLVIDSAGAWHLCTTSGVPGTWT